MVLNSSTFNYAISIIIANLFLPEYIEHVIARTEILVSFDKVVIMVFQLAFLALEEEIVWRAFFMKQCQRDILTM